MIENILWHKNLKIKNQNVFRLEKKSKYLKESNPQPSTLDHSAKTNCLFIRPERNYDQ